MSCSGGGPGYVTQQQGAELSGSLSTTGAQYQHTFASAGTFNYYCSVHPSCASLNGRIVVVAAGVSIENRVLALSLTGGSAGGPYGGATCSALSLAVDSVHVGDQVTWTNSSPLPHTVVSH